MTKKSKEKKIWMVREWDHYGIGWNQRVRNSYYFEAENKDDALAQYRATCTPDPNLPAPTVKASRVG